MLLAWILGLISCKAVAYLQGVSVCASVTTLVAISVDRFLAICYPMTLQITTRGCRIIIAAIWIFSLSLSLPWTVYFQLVSIGKSSYGDPLYVCREVWPTEQMGTVYFLVANLVICYLLPLLVFLVCYGSIWYRLCSRVLPGEGAHNNLLAKRSKIKVIKMLFLVVTVFMISWLPLYAVFIRVKVGGT
ncbi:hypothetical protein JTE90_022370 [Oedothorax gibbosus]|uniref:G-protein coupled receptors family 1 profile domain-containing protein n=1 Tax=Oedothorax gibbosus TaxID=931172 RepID=A0AAV6UNZ5_9ARAC|nr:hypothetical protein JTE90_022370 [Oedothorax gibbosus]